MAFTEQLRQSRPMTKTPPSREAVAVLDKLLTRKFLPTVVIVIAVPVIAFTLVVAFTSVSVSEANLYVDSAVKIVATLAAAAWALNRYFTNRVDAPQLRIDPHIDVVSADAFKTSSSDSMLLCRLSIVNTGQVRFSDYWFEVEIASVELGSNGTPAYIVINESQRLNGEQIEPGSWAAYSDAMALDRQVTAIRVYLEIRLKANPSQKYWTWHQLFKVTTESGSSNN